MLSFTGNDNDSLTCAEMNSDEVLFDCVVGDCKLFSNTILLDAILPAFNTSC